MRLTIWIVGLFSKGERTVQLIYQLKSFSDLNISVKPAVPRGIVSQQQEPGWETEEEEEEEKEARSQFSIWKKFSSVKHYLNPQPPFWRQPVISCLQEYVGMCEGWNLNPVTLLLQLHITENKVNPVRDGARVQTAPALSVSFAWSNDAS